MGASTPGPAGVEYREIEPGTAVFERSIELRNRVMYEPFGLPARIARGFEAAGAEHMGAFCGERLIGYGRILPQNEAALEARVYQLVVEPSWQHMGVGTGLMGEMIARARRWGAVRVTLDARLPAVGFYERLGFETTGDGFLMPRTQMPHLPMALALS